MNAIYHTDALLRKHRLLVKQDLTTDTFILVDWQTYKPASQKRKAAFNAEFEQGEHWLDNLLARGTGTRREWKRRRGSCGCPITTNAWTSNTND